MRSANMVEGAAKPAGPYSHAVVANGLVFVSGQGPADPATNAVPDGFTDQVRQTVRNLQTILRGVGADLKGGVKINPYLRDLTRFREYNEISKESFATDPPARAAVGCQLVGIQVEIDCI